MPQIKLGAVWCFVSGLVMSCATSGGGSPGQGQILGDTYVNVDEGFGFRIPPGWSPTLPGSAFASTPYVVRFAPITQDATVTVYTARLDRAPCLEAANQILAEHEGGRLSRTESFVVATPVGEVPAWRGVLTASTAQGGGSIFCAGGTVHVLSGIAPTASFAQHSEALEETIRSFSYAPILVQVAPPTPTPAYFVHEIKWRGQTLGQIAQWYTGEYGNWRKLTDINGLTQHGVALRVGRRIKIPEELVTKRNPLPPPRRPKKTPKPARTASPAAEPTPTLAAEPTVAPTAEATPTPPSVLPPKLGF